MRKPCIILLPHHGNVVWQPCITVSGFFNDLPLGSNPHLFSVINRLRYIPSFLRLTTFTFNDSLQGEQKYKIIENITLWAKVITITE